MWKVGCLAPLWRKAFVPLEMGTDNIACVPFIIPALLFESPLPACGRYDLAEYALGL